MISIYIHERNIVYTVKNIDEDPVKIGSVSLSEGTIVNGSIINHQEVLEGLKEVYKKVQEKNHKLCLVLPIQLLTVRNYELPKDIEEEKKKEYVIKYALQEMGEEIDFDHFYLGNKVTYFFYSKTAVKAYLHLFDMLRKKVDYIDNPIIAMIREQYYISKNKSAFASEVAIYFMKVPKKNYLVLVDGYHALFMHAFSDEGDDGRFDKYKKANDEAYRLANFYKWNISKGAKSVSKLYIYPLYNPDFDCQKIDSNLTEIDEVIMCNGKHNAYDLDSEYSITMSKSLFDPNLAHRIFDLRLYLINEERRKQKISTRNEPLSIFFTIIIIFALVITNALYYNFSKVYQNNLDYTNKYYNEVLNSIETTVPEITDGSDYFKDFEEINNYDRSSYQDLLAVLNSVDNTIQIENIFVDSSLISISFEANSLRDYLRFKDLIYDEFRPNDLEDAYVENGRSIISFKVGVSDEK